MRIVTTSEQLLYDLIQEQKRTNELLEKLIPAPAPIVEAPAPVVQEVKIEKSQPRRGR
jgi:hypothetical protein